ncbi:ABC transporter substrate-binding protein [Aquabacter spiritensis]|uniref:NitT/TauT family transport system substrate-binding protein n=1 Tax=Aquabacter spiritensis TaxID=933073 RepID=A0A4R3LWQ6_9HYPH|nr:ABC transporter substrate-binding protein [Aquabacter spiritensis]TCT05060.1 NitT/TauT family transport system substrate-binding protein [Aquabacter spiritensis]
MTNGFTRRRAGGILSALVAALMLAGVPSAARAEVSELRIPLGAGGFGFLPLHMMQKHKLIEKYAEEAGNPVTVNWSNIGGPAVMNDALLSGSAHFISAGPPAFLFMWDRTRSNMAVKSVGAISSMPMHLNARVADLKALDDISGGQKIAVTSVKVSIPSIIMQMYALKKYGKDQVFRFDPFTVTMSHPEAVITLLSGSGTIVAHWASAPFDQRELKDPAIRTIMNSDDVMGGSTTFTMMSTTTKFQTENPKVYGAVVKALKRAQEMIGEDKKAAAEVLLASMGGKGWAIDELVGILNDPSTKYTIKPENVLKYANFMHEIGSLKAKPAGLGDLFFEPKDLGGGN